MANTISLNEIIAQIREWQRETVNFRNDSWTQDIYQNRLRTLHDMLNPIINNVDSEYRADQQGVKDEEEKS